VRRRPVLATVVCLALTASAGVALADRPDRPGKPTAGGGSLPSVGSGARPGPDALYASAPDAPQLQNTGPWKAEPILVSGSHAYRDGEWLYQDFLFDDHGATGVPDNGWIYGPSDNLYSTAAGTFSYPADPVYAHNAADLVELRVKALKKQTAFRVTLNTLQDAERSAFTIALGSSDSTVEWPHGAGVSSPAQLFLTWHGRTAELTDADGNALPAPDLAVDLVRRQVELRLPHTVWNPGTSSVRTAIGVGLWDRDAGRYLAPRPGAASATAPGGGAPGGAALVNVGPRLDEPKPEIQGKGFTMADTAAAGIATGAWWRERRQAGQLTRGDVTPFAVDVDFGKLARKVRDDSGVPTTGSMNRILASRHVLGQGVDPTRLCFKIGRLDTGSACEGRFVGQLQPYTLYVPEKPAPVRGYGLTLLLHSLSANYNQYANSNNQSQLGERGAGSLVITPAGRGPDGFYAGLAETDTFEVWADVARRYRLDPDWTASTGYSMGGFGTYRLLARYPDLFSRGWSVVGAPGAVNDQLPSLRHTPVLAWNAVADELVNLKTAEDAHAALVAAGVQHEYRQHPAADHLTLASVDEWGPGVDFLGEHRVDRDPARVSYVVDPREDNAARQVVADHAYWLSGLRVRDPQTPPTAAVDVRSSGFGRGDAALQPVASSAGVMPGGALPMPWFSRTLSADPAPSAAPSDRLTVEATNLRSMTIDVRRARVSCQVALEVRTDGPLAVVLDGCGRTLRFDAGG
jgi:hypothetical protein